MSNALPNIPRLYTALAEWSACMVYLMMTRHSFKRLKFYTACTLALALQILLLTLTENIAIYLWIPCMISAVALMFAFIYLCADISWIDAGYYCVNAFVLAEFAASFEWQIRCFFMQSGHAPIYVELGLLFTVYVPVFLSAWLLEKRHAPKEGRLGITSKEMASTVIIGIVVFVFSNLSFISSNTPFSGQYDSEIFIIRTTVDAGGFAILYAHHMQCYELRVRRELESVQSILRNQYVQYQQSKESIDIINQKYHDMKHKIAVLRAEPDAVRRNAYLDKMEAEIKTYEAQNKTGNPVLDTVLTSKSLYSVRHGINLTCVANGKLLDFMDVMDICTIFGNALDNAIESAQRISDPEKRLIHVSVFAQKNFLIIRFENYYESELHFDGNMPVTTKKNRDYHGYGLKSIKYVAQKYGGSVSVQASNNWFDLKILIPM
ncbi:MAG TPA: ATP-binding protein [Ruminococcaceae bacterium]|nr:ATP-binding protein [Oscillospiraceae bacterium]